MTFPKLSGKLVGSELEVTSDCKSEERDIVTGLVRGLCKQVAPHCDVRPGPHALLVRARRRSIIDSDHLYNSKFKIDGSDVVFEQHWGPSRAY